MARANAAKGDARAHAWRLAAAIAHPFGAQLALRIPAPGIWLPYATPALAAALFVLAALSVVEQIRADGERALSSAEREVDIRASLLALRLNEALAAAPGQAPAAVLRRALDEDPALRDGEAMVADGAGGVVASEPPTATGASLTSLLGPAQPLTILADKAGVLRIEAADGADEFATVRALRPPLAQLAYAIHAGGLMAPWRGAALRSALLLITTALAMAAGFTAYFRQSARVKATERLARRARGRVDSALNRGRCGLWDWDLPRGRILWSRSMYELLGMTQSSEFLSFGDVQALVHPEDGDLAALARLAIEGEQPTIDHEFRMRNVAGDWVWLQARAELVSDDPGGRRHLVGVALDVTEQKSLAERNATADQRLREAIEAISEAFVLWDASNRLVLCNSKFQRLHNLPAEAVRPGASYAELAEQGTPPTIHSETILPSNAPPDESRSLTYEARLTDGRWLQINERRTKDGGY
ncbi:MAG TPA: PAS domain-containing protein, partial [Roseiarcus sp.]|nr:PAS domain-containing protein [Roseiarcus sp.]